MGKLTKEKAFAKSMVNIQKNLRLEQKKRDWLTLYQNKGLTRYILTEKGFLGEQINQSGQR